MQKAGTHEVGPREDTTRRQLPASQGTRPQKKNKLAITLVLDFQPPKPLKKKKSNFYCLRHPVIF